MIGETKLKIGVGDVASNGDPRAEIQEEHYIGAEFRVRSNITGTLSLYQSDRILGDGDDIKKGSGFRVCHSIIGVTIAAITPY